MASEGQCVACGGQAEDEVHCAGRKVDCLSRLQNHIPVPITGNTFWILDPLLTLFGRGVRQPTEANHALIRSYVGAVAMAVLVWFGERARLCKQCPLFDFFVALRVAATPSVFGRLFELELC